MERLESIFATFIFGTLQVPNTTENLSIIWRISQSLDRNVTLAMENPLQYSNGGDVIPILEPVINHHNDVKYWVSCDATLEVMREYCYLLAAN